MSLNLWPIVFATLSALCFIIAVPQIFFIQDDWYHIYQTYGKTLPEVLDYFNIWQKGGLDPLNFYRPLSTKLYFFLSYQLFGLKPYFYLAVNYLLFILNIVFLSKLLLKITKPKIALWTTFIYSFSLAHFTFFSYITKVEDLMFGALTFASLYFLVNKENVPGILIFILALMTRESALIIPLWLVGYYLFLEKKPKKYLLPIIGIFSISVIYILSRTLIYGWPKDQEVYLIQFGPHIISNIFKYLQWNLNLTGLLIQNSMTGWLYRATAAFFLIILSSGFLKAVKNNLFHKNIIFGIFWWLLFLSPVLLFPNHRDPWNLIVAAGGLSFALSQVVVNLNKTIRFLFVSSYLILFLLGLNFYRLNHWTVQRGLITKQTKEKILSQCQKDELTIDSGQYDTKELQYSWYYDLGPKILCKKTSLKVVYE